MWQSTESHHPKSKTKFLVKQNLNFTNSFINTSHAEVLITQPERVHESSRSNVFRVPLIVKVFLNHGINN